MPEKAEFLRSEQESDGEIDDEDCPDQKTQYLYGNVEWLDFHHIGNEWREHVNCWYSARLSLLFASVRHTELSILKPDVLARQESCRQEILREVLSEEFLFYKEPDQSLAKSLRSSAPAELPQKPCTASAGHLSEIRERHVDESSSLVKASLKPSSDDGENANGILPAVPVPLNCGVHSAAGRRRSDVPRSPHSITVCRPQRRRTPR
ncbi:MAG: hypothetical protein ACOC2Q_02560 [Spirochaetota bacterium]